ncbi:MAG: 1-deoxy-D-xylulose-5-phosphate reductoisomerase, partial [Candidatus Limnocylindrales bacterium]
AAASRGAELADQAAAARPRIVAVADRTVRAGLIVPAGTEVDDSEDGLLRLATLEDVDMVVVGTTGMVSLGPVLAALGAGKIVATANKETLVAGGHLVMAIASARAAEVARQRGAADPQASPLGWLRPIDSEHSAIWQCLVGEAPAEIGRLILTASGGPFLDAPLERFASFTPADALAHPTWRMGAKVTIDSATLMNKGLEVVEARWLYDVGYDRIDVAVHPQSIIHSAVEFRDGSVKAQLGLPDMRLPIQYALTHPRRLPSPAPRLALSALGTLTFRPPDLERFPALDIARAAGRAGPRATTALIAADEVAVARFLEGSLGFAGIPRLVGAAVEHFATTAADEPDLGALMALYDEARAWTAAQPGPGAA